MKLKFKVAMCLLAFGMLTLFLNLPAEGNRQKKTKLVPTNKWFSTKDISGETNAADLLSQIAGDLAQSSPASSQIHVAVSLFGRTNLADGNYLQMGQGSGLSRLEFDLSSIGSNKSVVQISNQGYLYRFVTLGEQTKLDFMDLRRIQEADYRRFIASPAAWMSSGGMPSQLEMLAANFNFDSAEVGQTTRGPMLRLRGTWIDERLKRLLFGQINYNWIRDEIHWKKIPQQIPEFVEIDLEPSGGFDWLPTEIRFLRSQLNEKQRDHQIEEKSIELVSIRYENWQFSNPNVTADLFSVQFDGIPDQDLTARIVERIDELNQVERSANNTKPIQQNR